MDYTALEMDVAVGETVKAGRKLNGWIWCSSPEEDRQGWVPEQNLQMLDG
ncbi:SH3 domain-containing protein [Acidovorax sp. CCYZU-2555]|nr:SH3 domain-containing protein [Acidovorax sp. CCYZU-2555]